MNCFAFGRVFVLLVGGWMILASGVFAAPSWLTEAARQPDPPHVGAAPITRLLDETRIVIADDGTPTEEHRVAMRINTIDGKRSAIARVDYLDHADTVTDSTAWLLRHDKVVDTDRAGKWFDMAITSAGAVYDEYRTRLTAVNNEVQVGDVFGYETVVRRHQLFSQFIHKFQTTDPTISERFILEVPAGWPVTAGSLNGTGLVAYISPDRRVWRWEQSNWPYAEPEPHSVSDTRIVPIVYGSFEPTSSAARGLATFHTWSDASDWQIKLSNGQCDSDPALAAKARELTAHCPDLLSRIRALCRFVQDSVSYVATNRNLGIGFGYRPRKATEIAAKAYGDCKDKVNILAAMLREIGVRSYLLSVRAEENAVTIPDWPSLTQFNHAIIGIEVDDSIQLPTVITHTPCGRLLVFDPTEPNTPLGSLPLVLQGNKAALYASGKGQLLDLPVLSPADDRLVTRTVHLRVAPDGGASGSYTLVARGQMGALERRWVRIATPQVLRETVARRLAGFLPAVEVKSVTPRDEPDRNICGFKSQLSIDALGQRVANGYLVVHLDVPSRVNRPLFSAAARKTPIQLEALEFGDEFVLDLPPNVSVEEHPDDTVIESPFGRYSAHFEVTADKIICRYAYSQHAMIVPISDYDALKKFLASAAAADPANFLLKLPR